MTLSELIETLTNLQEEKGDIEVRVAYQPNYPLQSQLAGVAVHSDHDEDVAECYEMLATQELTDEERTECQASLAEHEEKQADSQMAYLLEGGSNSYASRNLWDNLYEG